MVSFVVDLHSNAIHFHLWPYILLEKSHHHQCKSPAPIHWPSGLQRSPIHLVMVALMLCRFAHLFHSFHVNGMQLM